MSDAPERIWADGNAEWDSGSWGHSKEFDNDVEYVRADRIEELEAENARLREYYDAVEAFDDKPWKDDVLVMSQRVRDARAALAELKGENQ